MSNLRCLYGTANFEPPFNYRDGIATSADGMTLPLKKEVRRASMWQLHHQATASIPRSERGSRGRNWHFWDLRSWRADVRSWWDRTLRDYRRRAEFDPNRTLAVKICCDAQRAAHL